MAGQAKRAGSTIPARTSTACVAPPLSYKPCGRPTATARSLLSRWAEPARCRVPARSLCPVLFFLLLFGVWMVIGGGMVFWWATVFWFASRERLIIWMEWIDLRANAVSLYFDKHSFVRMRTLYRNNTFFMNILDDIICDVEKYVNINDDVCSMWWSNETNMLADLNVDRTCLHSVCVEYRT